MTRQVRTSVPADDSTQPLSCGLCGLGWNRPRKPGRVPRYCSDRCKQAAWRQRVGPEEYRRRERASEQRRRRAWTLAMYHREFAAVTAKNPLKTSRVMPLLRELAGATPWDPRPAVRLYKTAALQWHPDTPDGDHHVFQLLNEAHRIAKLMNL